MDKRTAGFREIEHTADWEMEAWANDLAGLLEQAATGMGFLAGMRLSGGPRQVRIYETSASDPESLVVRFLTEILFYAETEHLGFDSYDLALEGYHLVARLKGAPIQSIEKEIKAVTWHNLQVRFTEQGVQVRVVFDV